MQLDLTERRVIGALVEKRWTTPDQYPLTLNALVSACNQKSNRDPVLALGEFEIEGCLRQLRMRGLVTVHERDGGRVARYSERFGQDLELSREDEAMLAELLLRGDQTAPELQRRACRMAPFAGPQDAEERLRDLARRSLVRLLPKQTGQRHPRWTHLLAPEDEQAPTPHVGEAIEPKAPETPMTDTTSAKLTSAGDAACAASTGGPPTLESLAREMAELRSEVAELRARLTELEST